MVQVRRSPLARLHALSSSDSHWLVARPPGPGFAPVLKESHVVEEVVARPKCVQPVPLLHHRNFALEMALQADGYAADRVQLRGIRIGPFPPCARCCDGSP